MELWASTQEWKLHSGGNASPSTCYLSNCSMFTTLYFSLKAPLVEWWLLRVSTLLIVLTLFSMTRLYYRRSIFQVRALLPKAEVRSKKWVVRRYLSIDFVFRPLKELSWTTSFRALSVALLERLWIPRKEEPLSSCWSGPESFYRLLYLASMCVEIVYMPIAKMLIFWCRSRSWNPVYKALKKSLWGPQNITGRIQRMYFFFLLNLSLYRSCCGKHVDGRTNRLLTILREEGPAALYKGFVPKVLRLAPGGGVLLLVVEFTLTAFRKGAFPIRSHFWLC